MENIWTDEKERDAWFAHRGFERREWFDKDSRNSPRDDLRFVEYAFVIEAGITVDVSFGYRLADAGWQLMDQEAVANFCWNYTINASTPDEIVDAVKWLKKLFRKGG